MKITSAPSPEVWYASQIGKKFRVVWEYPTHFEVKPNRKKWPEDVCLLVPVEDCVAVKSKKKSGFWPPRTHEYQHPSDYPRYGEQRPPWYENLGPDEQQAYDDVMQLEGMGAYRRW